MKKLLFLVAITVIPYLVSAQSCCAQSCDKKSCGPEGTKKEEAAVIKSMRTDLQLVVNKMSQSSLSFNKEVAGMTIEKGTSDDESLLFLSQAVTTIRYELLNKVDASKLVASLKEYKPTGTSTKQQMVSALKKDIQVLASQAEKL
jgi:hypothetical protein